MSAIRLKGYRALEISFTGRLAPGTKIQLENKYNYNVRYTKENLCVCNLECSVFDKV